MVNNKILGSILGAALGDAMGAVTETRSVERIKEDFGGYIDKLIDPPDDCFAHGYPLGSVTDDFSLAYFTAIELVKAKGVITDEVAKAAVINWSEYPQFFHFAGPTTEAAVRKMKGIDVPPVIVNGKTEDGHIDRSYVAADNGKATNGSAMKIFSAGLINPGNVEKAIEDTVTICMPTHPNDASISGAAAISAAVAKAMEEGVTLDDVLNAGIYGAEKGKKLAQERGAHRLAVPSVSKRIKLAVEIGKRGLGWEEAMFELRDIIGAGLMIVESVPCVFGILAATSDPFAAVKMGVNIGDDTDTVATMVGGVAGAFYGTGNMPTEYLKVMDKTNEFHPTLEELAKQIEDEFYAG